MTNKTLYIIIAVILVLAAGFFAMRLYSPQKPLEMSSKDDAKQEQKIPETQSNMNQASTSSPETSKTPEQKVMAEIIVKNFGTMKLELDSSAAPKTVANFVKLANQGFYNGLSFHRVAKDFVIQGGDPKGDGTGGPGYTVPAEIKLLHKKGAIAMARTGDQINPARESSGSQFYIALNDLTQLDGQYTVFGYVVQGMEVAEKIGKVEIDSPYGDGAPKEKVLIESVKILK
jgi:peptidyl-prolyl cis-trans isomerase B (cyclophilin B)